MEHATNDPGGAQALTFEQELEEARKLEEGFEAREVPEDEEPEVAEVNLDAEAFARQAVTIKTLSERLSKAERLLRRYIAAHGPLED